MRRRDLLRALTATPLTAWLRPWLPGVLVATEAGPSNAAALYRETFTWAERLGEQARSQLMHAQTLPVEHPLVTAFIGQAQTALVAIRHAATIAHCDWQSEVLTHAHLGTGRMSVWTLNVINLACLSGRRHAAEGRAREAFDDLFAALALAHRLGGHAVLFARMIECAGEACAFGTLGRIVPRLDRPALDELSRRLDALPPPAPASAAIGPEGRFIVSSVRAKLDALGPRIGDADWEELGFEGEEAAALQRLTAGDRAGLVVHLDQTCPAFEELGRRLDLPRPQCREAFDQFIEAARKDQPIVASLGKNGWSARHVVDRMLALRAMLRAGLALARDGEAGFRSVDDPFGAGPFGLERSATGDVIRSALREDGRPEVTLVVGGPA